MQSPEWIDPAIYPFEPNVLDVAGGKMHYVDEGEGSPILMVHGTPTWSFLYRDLIKELSRSFRVIAPDHIGFGLSDKPPGWSYRPQDHARNLAALIETLGLEDLALVVHDFGGPIGLSYALDQPENVSRLVLFNTWMWPIEDTTTRWASWFFGSPAGRFMYKRLNFSPRVLLKAGFADERKLTEQIHQHYLRPFPSKEERQGPWVLAKELTGSDDWYTRLWEKRAAIEGMPALLLWGLKDPLIGTSELARWKSFLKNAEVREYADAGHFVQEEVGNELVPLMNGFLKQS